MYIGNSLIKPQADLLEKTQQEVEFSLNDPSIALILGGYAAKLSNINGQLFVPNLDSYGRHSIPQSFLETEAIPAITFTPYLDVNLDNTFGYMSPKQRKNASARLAEIGYLQKASGKALDGMSRTVGKIKTIRISPHESTHLGFNGAYAYADVGQQVVNGMRKSRRLLFCGRSIVGISEILNPSEYVNTALHEEVHALQKIEDPVIDEQLFVGNTDVSRELEARSVEADFALSRHVLGVQELNNNSSNTVKLNSRRKELNSEEQPFYPHPELAALLGMVVNNAVLAKYLAKAA
jgi:hypothetical protein